MRFVTGTFRVFKQFLFRNICNREYFIVGCHVIKILHAKCQSFIYLFYIILNNSIRMNGSSGVEMGEAKKK